MRIIACRMGGRVLIAAMALMSTLAPIPATAADIPPIPSAGCAAATIESGSRLEHSLDVRGTSRSYILDVPAGIAPGTPVPLLLDFHGLGHSGAGVWRVSGFREIAAREHFITVYPDGLFMRFPHPTLKLEGPGWEIAPENNRDLAFTERLLDHLEQVYCIDRARVFSTGFSNGAYFSHLLGCMMSDRIAAIAPVSGGQIPGPCTPSRGVPVLIHHGRQDDIVEVDKARLARDAWVEVDQCREHASNGCEWHRECRDHATVEYCEGDFAHHWPEDATVRIWAFLTAHPMPPAPAKQGQPTTAAQRTPGKNTDDR